MSMSCFCSTSNNCARIRYNKELYLLVTDIAFSRMPNLVWEKLSTVDGDTFFVDANFVLHNPQISEPSVHPTDKKTSIDEQLALQMAKKLAEEQEKKDAAIALSMIQGGVGRGGPALLKSEPSRAATAIPTPEPTWPSGTVMTDEEFAKKLQQEEQKQARQSQQEVIVQEQLTDEELARRLHRNEIEAADQNRRDSELARRLQEKQSRIPPGPPRKPQPPRRRSSTSRRPEEKKKSRCIVT